MAQQVRALAVLVVDQGSVQAHTGWRCSQTSMTPVPGDSVPILTSAGTKHIQGSQTHMQAKHTHMKYNKPNINLLKERKTSR